jgi:very-short-patch-repair endonuclease
MRITTRRHGIPVTTIQRTIEDLERTVPPRLLRRAKRQAELKGIHLQGVEPRRQRSDFEEDFLALFLAHRFPQPENNVKLARHEVDFLWRDQRLVVEADSFAYHQGSVTFHADHARDLDLREGDYTVLRFDEQQLEEEPERIAAVVAAALRS